MAAVQTTYTATAGDRIVLQCPIQPGALLEYYSVKWMKGNVPIAKARNPYDISTVNSRYSIDATSYSLAIDDVGLNDSSTYRCDLFATIPATKARRRLRFNQDRDILLSLRVLGKFRDYYYYVTYIVTKFNYDLTLLFQKSQVFRLDLPTLWNATR